MHFSSFGYSAIFIGCSFALPTLIYAVTSPLIYILTAKIKKTGVILIGYNVIFIAFLFIGPSVLFGPNNDSAVISMIGLAILGFGCGMIIIPILPDMIESIEERYNGGINEAELHNNISGLFIAF